MDQMLRRDTCRGPEDAVGRIRAARTSHLFFFFGLLPPISPLTGAERVWRKLRQSREEWPYLDGWKVSPVPSSTRLLSGGPGLDGAVGPGVDSQMRGPLGIPTQ